MKSNRKTGKKPSRIAYEKAHPTISFRLDKETYGKLKGHLRAAGSSFADFVKDALGREKTLVEERVKTLASSEIEEKHIPESYLKLYGFVLDLAQWNIILWLNLSNPLEIICPSCFFPSPLRHQEGKKVFMEMLNESNGDYKCSECGLRINNPPQLAWALLVSKVAEEVRREKFLSLPDKDITKSNKLDDAD